MTEHVSGSLGQCLKMGSHIREQEIEVAALMVMRDHSSRDLPKPLNTVSIGIISRRIDQVQVLFQLAKHALHKQGTSGSMRPEIIGNHDGDSPATLRTGNGSTHLFTEHVGSASGSNPAIEPAIAPVDQAKAVDLAVVSRCLDQALAAPTFAAPDTRESRVKGKLNLILQIEVGLRQQGDQTRQVGGKLIPQISLNQIVYG